MFQLATHVQGARNMTGCLWLLWLRIYHMKSSRKDSQSTNQQIASRTMLVEKKPRAKPRKTTKIESVLLCRTTASHNYFITSTSQQLCDSVRVNMNSVLFFSYFFFQKGKSSTSFVYSVLNLYKYARTERIRDSAKQLMRKVSLEIRS